MKSGMGSHQKTVGDRQEHLTPPEIIRSLGEFDLDPCAPIIRPWDMAKKHLTIIDNGLIQPWHGRVWMNPPYDRYMIGEWMKKMAEWGNGIALTFARTETEFMQNYVFPTASSILFIKGRLTFYDIYGNKVTTKDGKPANGGAPSVLIAYGDSNSQAISESGIKGAHLPVNTVPIIVVEISPSWTSVVTIALNRTKEADIQTIYSLVEQIAPDKCKNNPHYKEKIRQKLQLHFTRPCTRYYTFLLLFAA